MATFGTNNETIVRIIINSRFVHQTLNAKRSLAKVPCLMFKKCSDRLRLIIDEVMGTSFSSKHSKLTKIVSQRFTLHWASSIAELVKKIMFWVCS